MPKLPVSSPPPPQPLLHQLALNLPLVTQQMVDFVGREIRRVGLSRAVVGLSGGIDSAVSCYLAALALGPENVLAVRLPYRTSSAGSLSDAQAVIDDLGVLAETVEITDMVDPLFERVGIGTESRGERLRRGNIMARQRMIVLYDQSAAFGGLVVGTGNRTEMLLGYSTLFGDSAHAINPIGDLYKCQVRQVATHLGTPRSILDKPPSADLWVGQTDEDELGFTYDQADQILHLLYDQRLSPAQIAGRGFDLALVEKIEGTVRRNQYKRTMPVICKIGPRTVGRDFRYPRDWGT